jgi:hypothetical protein
MSDGFKGTDFCELHHALGLKIEDDTDVDLEFLQWHLGNIVNRMMLTDEKCDREVELCRGYVQAHIDHLRDHKCISSSEDAIAVYEAVMRVREPHFFMKLTTGLIGMMWC